MQLGLYRAGVLLVLLNCFLVAEARGERRSAKMGVFTKDGAEIDLKLPFADASGRAGPLKSFLKPGRPFILVPTFYRCPRLCSLTVSGLLEYVNQSKLRLGNDYSIVMYSFNPAEGPAEACEKELATLRRVERDSDETGWKFLTGSEGSISQLNGELDFRVRMADKEFEHSSAIFVFSPEGRLRRYFAGVEFPTTKVDAALLGKTAE